MPAACYAKLVLLPCSRGQSQESQAYIIGIKDSQPNSWGWIRTSHFHPILSHPVPIPIAAWYCCNLAAGAYLQLIWTHTLGRGDPKKKKLPWETHFLLLLLPLLCCCCCTSLEETRNQTKQDKMKTQSKHRACAQVWRQELNSHSCASRSRAFLVLFIHIYWPVRGPPPSKTLA